MKKWLFVLICGPGNMMAHAEFPIPTHFPGCEQNKVDFFAYANDHRHAVEMCLLPDGWRFSYGLIEDESNVVSFKVGQDDLVNVEWDVEKGVMAQNYAIMSDPEGGLLLRVNSETEPFGTWALVQPLDIEWHGYVNHVYVCDTPDCDR